MADFACALEDAIREAIDAAVRKWGREWRPKLAPGAAPEATLEFVGKVRGTVSIAGQPLTSTGLYVSWPPGRVMVPPP